MRSRPSRRPRTRRWNGRGLRPTCRPGRTAWCFRLLTFRVFLSGVFVRYTCGVNNLSERNLSSQVLSAQLALEPNLEAWIRFLRAHASLTRELSGRLEADHGLTL